MLPRIFRAALVAALLLTSGCYRTTFVNSALSPTNEEDSFRQPFFLWGIVGDGEIDVRKTCKYDALQIVYSADFLDVLVSTVTLGLLALRSVDIQCGAPAPSPAVAR